MKTLKDVKVGETATVAKLHGEGPVKLNSAQALFGSCSETGIVSL